MLLCARILVNNTENMRETVRDDAALRRVSRVAHHRVRLATTCLTICENRAVVTLEHGFDKRESGFIVDALL